MAITSGVGPHFASLTVNGTTLPIEAGTVDQNATKKSSTFSAALPLSYPGAEATLAALGDNTAVISVSTRGVSAPLITGEIDTTEFDYVGRIIRITGRDKSAALHENTTSEKWVNKKGSEIITDLAGRVGLGVSATSSLLMAGKKLQQDFVRLSNNETFSTIFHKIAELDGARWWVDAGGTLQYHPINSPQGAYTLNYVPPTSGPMSGDFMLLMVRRNVQAGKGIAAHFKTWHPKDRELYQHTATRKGNGGPKNYTYHIPNSQIDHIKQQAEARADELARHELVVVATVVGDPTIDVAMALQLNGTGKFDQSYEMDTICHSFGMDGHRMTITAKAGKIGREEEDTDE